MLWVQAALHKLVANQRRLIEQFQRDAEEASLSADKRKAAIDKVSYLTQQAEEMKGLAVRVLEYFTCIRTDLYIWDVADTLEAHSGIVPTDPDPASRSRRARIARKFMIQSGIATIITRLGSTTAAQRKIIESVVAELRAGGLVDAKNALRGRFVRDDIHAMPPTRTSAKRVTEGIIKTQLHLLATPDAVANDGDDSERPWGYDEMALADLNSPSMFYDMIPHSITDQASCELGICPVSGLDFTSMNPFRG